MECNRDEAIRAKEIAERKFTEKNYAAAKKFASKARNLYPQLEGLNQMLITIDVFISFENKINGKVDWYGILSVNPSADDDTIRKQYRKLALVLHPDKNKSLGAEDAFKLVSEAWSLLSNKAKRLAYNQKRNLKEFQQKVQPQTGRPTVSSGASGCHKFTRSVNSNVTTQDKTEIGSTSIPPVKKTGTFWTICNKCKTYYEYLRIYLNHTLLCQKCHEAFMALEKGLPPHVSMSSNMYYYQQSQKPVGGNQFNSGRNCPAAHGSEPGMSSGINSSCETNSQRTSCSKATVPGTTFGQKYGAAHSVSMNQLTSKEKLKRELEERQCIAELGRSEFSSASSNAARKPDTPWKKRKIEDIYLNDHRGLMANQGLGKGNSGIDTVFHFTDMHNMPERNRELPYPEIKNMLMFKARTEIGRRLQKRSSVTMEEAKSEQKLEEEDKVKNQKSTTKDDTVNMRRNESVIFDNKPEACDSIYKEDNSPSSINVPDPDFHNFDLDRTEDCFSDDQVWAAYDDDDGMPRYYARIHKMMSLTPLKMRISWLNSKSNSELGPLDWIGSGFTKTCGEFRTSRRETATTLNSFSHKVSWIEGPRGLIQIYPRKGEVWALYRNWSLEWNERTSDEVIHKYDMVEVLDDFDEEQGVSIAPLVKVAGFKTVFYLKLDPKDITRVPKEEMFRFSHQVPNYQLTGEEAHNAPKGCFELDPAALPLELLQVTTKVNDATTIENVSITEEVAS